MNAPTDWLSAVAILASGLVLGALFVFFFKRNKTAPIVDADLERKDLEAKRDALIAQLRDPELTIDERARLERDTADVLRRLDAHAPVAAPATPASARVGTPPAPGISPFAQGFLWGAGSVAALAFLGYLVMNSAKERGANDSVTGGGPMQTAPMQNAQQQQQQQPPDPAVLQLEAAVQRDPNNLALRNQLAQAYLERDNLMAVFEQTKFVLAKSPNDSRALTFQAIVRMAMGDTTSAEQMLKKATASDPKNLDGWVALAWVYANSNRMKDAEAMIAAAQKQSPQDAARLQEVLTQMRNAGQTQAAQNGLPEGHPSIDGAPAAGAAPAAAGPSVHVTIDLDPSARSKGGILFVIARNPAGGPPAAVKRLEGVQFPVTIDLSSADSMMGQPLPPSFRLEARLDSDGNPLTKTPNDPAAAQENVAPGATVRLALK
ncbi:MAG TPA: tetratricopeptide repeat protein [Thermoanaerobaculia bacterium]|jgi:Flp pilus assembly protein TadD